MPLSFLSSHTVGTSDESFWSEIYEYTPEDPEVLHQKGRLVIVVSAKSDSNLQQFLIKNVFDKIKNAYYEFEGEPLDALKNSLADINPGDGVELGVISFTEENVYCVVFSELQVILLRNGMYVTLLRGKESETKSLSGHIRANDTIIFGTKRFFEIANEKVLKSALISHTTETVADFLESLISVQERQSQSAAYFTKLNEKEEKQKDITNDAPAPPPRSFLHGKPLYIRSEEPYQQKRKTPVLIGILLVICLVASIVWGAKRQEEKVKEESFQSQVDSIQSKLDESTSLANINPERARSLFLEAQNEASNLTSENHIEKIEELKNKVNELQEKVLGERPVDLSLFVDFSLLSEGFTTKEISIDGSNAYILDSESKKIAKVSLSSKRAEIIAGPSIVDEIYAIATYADNIYGLSEDEIQEISSQKKVIDEGWKNALIYAYAGNIYLLDKDSSEIYRYTRGDTGFSEKERWLKEGVTAELTNAKSWVIDGSIWILKNDNTLWRFTNGTYWEFTPQGVFPEIASITSVYTSGEEEFLYLFERDSGRVVVVTKEGEFERQYVSDDLKEGSAIIASEEDGKFFVVTNDKLLSFEM